MYRGSGSGSMVSDTLDTLASVPWFIIGVVGIGWEWATSHVRQAGAGFRSRRGYRNIPIDEDAQILRFEDERE